MRFASLSMRLAGTRTIAAALWLGSLLPLKVRGDHVWLKPVADTFISEAYPDKNFGAMTFFNSGTTQNFTTNRALLKFDIQAAIPAGAKILSVILTNEVIGQPNEPWNSANFGLHRILRDWGEGDNVAGRPEQAAPADLGEANWTHRFAKTTNTWGQAGGQAGVDYAAVPSETEFVYDAGLYYLFGPTAQMGADVQQWLDDPATNFGWMLIVQNETTDFTARRFGSREDPFDYPKLGIDYSPPPQFTKIEIVREEVRFTFHALANNSYVVESLGELSGTNSWAPLTYFGPAARPVEVTIAEPASGPSRFYRIRFQ